MGASASIEMAAINEENRRFLGGSASVRAPRAKMRRDQIKVLPGVK